MFTWIILSGLCVASIAVALLPATEPPEWEQLSVEERAGSSRALVIAALLIVAFLGFVVSGVRGDDDCQAPQAAATHRMEP